MKMLDWYLIVEYIIIINIIFKLDIPNNLVNKITSEQEYQGKNTLFKFYLS